MSERLQLQLRVSAFDLCLTKHGVHHWLGLTSHNNNDKKCVFSAFLFKTFKTIFDRHINKKQVSSMLLINAGQL